MTVLKRRAVDGVLLLDKPVSVSSARALARVKGVFRAAKAGHTGALDPLASGLLPVCLGEATKFAAYFLQGDKIYLAAGRLGAVTATQDAEGEVLEARPVGDALDRLERVLEKFKGTLRQTPPIYSAVKIAGRPLYKYARSGQEVEVPAREIRIHELKLLEAHGGPEPSFTVEVRCSKGTYIRTLIADIGQALGCGAYVSMLRRVGVEGLPAGPLTGLQELQDLADGRVNGEDFSCLDSLLLPIADALGALPSVQLPPERAVRLWQGQRQGPDLSGLSFSREPAGYEGPWRVCSGGRFWGVAGMRAGVLVPERMMSCPFKPGGE